MTVLANIVPQDVGTSSPSQEIVPLDCNPEIPAASSHFDSPDPSPVRLTNVLPPFLFVASHYATNNPDFSGFHFSPALGDLPALDTPVAGSGAYRNGLEPHQYQPLPQDFELNPENLFDSPQWTTDQIDELIRNLQTESSLEYASQQPNSYTNL